MKHYKIFYKDNTSELVTIDELYDIESYIDLVDKEVDEVIEK